MRRVPEGTIDDGLDLNLEIVLGDGGDDGRCLLPEEWILVPQHINYIDHALYLVQVEGLVNVFDHVLEMFEDLQYFFVFLQELAKMVTSLEARLQELIKPGFRQEEAGMSTADAP